MTVLAHAKWFVDEAAAHPADWGFASHPRTLAFVAGAVVLAGVVAFADHRRPLAPVPLGALRRHVPRLLAGSLGLSLAVLATQGRLISPTVAVDGVGLPAAELLVALWLITGARLRGAAVAVGGLIAAMALVAGPLAVLESGVVPGIALCLALTESRAGARALRVGLGGSLVVVAFTEKLAAPAVTQAVLEAHQPLDVLADPAFVGLAGAAELLLGLLLLSGAASQLVALGALVPFVSTVVVFGVPELVGHLPIYGALAALTILGSVQRAPGRPALRAARRPLAVLATLPSDSHTWNLVFLQLLLERHGHEVLNLGPCTPVDLVVRSCARHRPELLVISSVNGHGHADGHDLIAAVRAHPALHALPVVIGGKLDVSGDNDGALAGPLLRSGYDAVFSEAAGTREFEYYLGHAPGRALVA